MAPLLVQLAYTITFNTAYHIGSGYGLAGLIDAGIVRRRDGSAYVPGSSLKGRVRAQITQMLQLPPNHDLACCDPTTHVCSLCNLFGSPLLEGTLYFGDACLADDWDMAARAEKAASAAGREKLRPHERNALQRRSQVEVRHGVRIHRRRGVAVDEMLFVTEAGQAGLRFKGHIEGTLADRARAFSLDDVVYPQDLAWLVAGLSAIRQLGGRKSRGLGYCTVTVDAVHVHDLDADTQTTAQPAPSALLGTLLKTLEQPQTQQHPQTQQDEE